MLSEDSLHTHNLTSCIVVSRLCRIETQIYFKITSDTVSTRGGRRRQEALHFPRYLATATSSNKVYRHLHRDHPSLIQQRLIFGLSTLNLKNRL